MKTASNKKRIMTKKSMKWMSSNNSTKCSSSPYNNVDTQPRKPDMPGKGLTNVQDLRLVYPFQGIRFRFKLRL